MDDSPLLFQERYAYNIKPLVSCDQRLFSDIKKPDIIIIGGHPEHVEGRHVYDYFVLTEGLGFD